MEDEHDHLISFMDRKAVHAALLVHHEAFIRCIQALPADQLNISHNGKWSPAQHLDHILRAVGPVNMALGLPMWLLRMAFGKPNRPPRTYEALVQRYHERLAAGGRASGRFVPPAVPSRSAERMSTALQDLVRTLNRRVGRWLEKDLDTTLLPHPLLGKLTLREMLYFTIYHVQHHQRLVEQYKR
jgi:DinB superfamily